MPMSMLVESVFCPCVYARKLVFMSVYDKGSKRVGAVCFEPELRLAKIDKFLTSYSPINQIGLTITKVIC